MNLEEEDRRADVVGEVDRVSVTHELRQLGRRLATEERTVVRLEDGRQLLVPGLVVADGDTGDPARPQLRVQVKAAKAAAAELGLEVKESAISTSGEVQQAAQSLDVDAFYVPTDNNVVSALESLLQVAEDKKILTIAAEGDSVERGAVATYGISYEKLGYQTGEMAV